MKKKNVIKLVTFIMSVTLLAGNTPSLCVVEAGENQISVEEDIQEEIVGDSSDFTYMIDSVKECATITGYSGIQAEVMIPEVINGYSVKSISDFSGNDLVQKVIIPQSVTRIENSAFEGCSKLEEVILPDTLEYLGIASFSECDSLQKINIPDSMEIIKRQTFYKCRNLKDIILPANLKEIELNAFGGCSALISVNIPEKVTVIGESAFNGCSKLGEVNLPEGLEEIKDKAFAFTGIRKLLLPESLKYLRAYCFEYCDELEEVTMLGDTKCGDCVFMHCSNLKKVIMSGNTRCEVNIFNDCSSLDTFIAYANPYISLGRRLQDNGSVYGLANADIYTQAINYGYSYYKIDAPTELKTEDIGISVSKVTWKTVNNVSGYKIYRSNDLNTGYQLVAITTSNEYIDTGLDDDLNYYYKVSMYYQHRYEVEGVLSEAVKRVEHIWNDNYTIDKDATCIETGVKNIHCKVCDAIKTGSSIVIPYKAHTFIDKEIIKEATCTEMGRKKVYCISCHNSFEEDTPMKNHIWDGGKITEEPTCTEQGEKLYTCTLCKETKVKTISAKGHAWNSLPTVEKEATCTETGRKSIHCGVCDVIKPGSVEEIPAIAHSWSSGEVTEEATCTEVGKKTSVCAVCKKMRIETIPAKGHAWNSLPTVEKEAACAETGRKSIHCGVCDAIKPGSVEEIPAIAHSWSSGEVTEEATCTEVGKKTFVCAVCNKMRIETILAKGHSWSDWEETIPPTSFSEGKAERKCSKCQKIDIRVINKLPVVDTVLINQPKVIEGDRIKITWKPVKHADGYIIYRKENGKWISKSVVDSGVLSYIDNDTVIGKSYTYTVRAYEGSNNKKNYGGYNKKGVFITQNFYNKKTEIKSVTALPCSIKIKWKARNKSAGYMIYRRTSNTGWKRIKIIKNAKKTVYEDYKVNSATTYYYTVKAYAKHNGKNIFSRYNKQGIGVTTKMLSPIVRVTSNRSGTATITWTKQKSVSGYILYRKKGDGGRWVKVKAFNSKTSSYTDIGLDRNKWYYYRVRAYKKKGIAKGIPKKLFGPYNTEFPSIYIDYNGNVRTSISFI